MLISAHVSLSDWTSVVGLGFAALAAFFAGRAVHWARKTVNDSEKANSAASERHGEQLAEARSLLAETRSLLDATRDAHAASIAMMEKSQADAATHAGWLLGEMKAATEASKQQHQIEMHDRQQAAEVAMSDRQMEQLQRVADLLVDYADTALEELSDPLPDLSVDTDGASIQVPANRLPALYARLHVETIALEMYGGRDLTKSISEPSRYDRSTVGRAWNEAQQILMGLAEIAEQAAEETRDQLATEQATAPENASGS